MWARGDDEQSIQCEFVSYLSGRIFSVSSAALRADNSVRSADFPWYVQSCVIDFSEFAGEDSV
jgi:hypothetical protein